jgi:hypothetical protein
MNYLFIILPAIAIASVVLMYILTRNAQEIKEEPPVIKFEPRKVTDLSKPAVDAAPVPAPKKKKYYKRRPKKTE